MLVIANNVSPRMTAKNTPRGPRLVWNASSQATGIWQTQKQNRLSSGRRGGIPRTVERCRHHHPIGVGNVPVAEHTQAGYRQRGDRRIAGEQRDDLLAKAINISPMPPRNSML